MLSIAHLSLECVIRIIEAINDNHLVIGSVLGIDLNEQTESVDSEVLPVIATRAVDEASDGLARFLYQSAVGVDAGDCSNTLIGDGCTNVCVCVCVHVGGMYGNDTSDDVETFVIHSYVYMHSPPSCRQQIVEWSYGALVQFGCHPLPIIEANILHSNYLYSMFPFITCDDHCNSVKGAE